MKRCEACSYTPRTEPKVFCPSCGAMWKSAAPPKSKRAVKGEGQRKGPTKPKLVITEVAVERKTTTGKQKRNPTKKG